MSKRKLTKADWCFHGVEDWELGACLLWEYSRESETLLRTVPALCERYPRENWSDQETRGQWRDLLMSGLWFSYLWDEAEAIEALRCFPGPWQELDLALRKIVHKCFAHQFDRFQPGNLIRRSTLIELFDLVKQNPDVNNCEAGDAVITIAKQGVKSANLCSLETLALTINWDGADDELLSAFKTFLSANRPRQHPSEPVNGHELRGMRSDLNALGVARVIARFGIKEIEDKAPQAWQSLKNNLFGNRPYDMRRDAVRCFRELFPKEQKPAFILSLH